MDEQNNQNPNHNQKMKMITIQKRHQYYSNQNREGEFAPLPGHIRRAIEREANFQVESLMKTPSLNQELSANNYAKANELMGMYCEYYAHKGNQEQNANPHNPNNLFKRLIEADSRTIARDNTGLDSTSHFNNKTTRHSIHNEAFMQKYAPKDAEGKIVPSQTVNIIKDRLIKAAKVQTK